MLSVPFVTLTLTLSPPTPALAPYQVGHTLGMFHPDSATDGHFNLSLAESLRNNRTDLSGQIASSVLPGVPSSSWDCLDPWENVVITNNTRVRRAATDLSLSPSQARYTYRYTITVFRLPLRLPTLLPACA